MVPPDSPSKRHNPDSVWAVPEHFRNIYAHAVETRSGLRHLYISGQVGIAPDGGIAPDFAAQCLQAIRNVECLLAAGKMSMADVVKVTCYLTRIEDLPALYECRQTHFAEARPAVTTVIVVGLADPKFFVEIDVTAAAV